MVVADISGSVAAFARFTLMFVYAIQNQFSKVRSFVFIDGIDEVTKFFKSTEDIGEAINRVNSEADVVWVDGHSDYGHAFEVFFERYGKDINSKTTVLLLGDARNNYHAAQSWVKNLEPKDAELSSVGRARQEILLKQGLSGENAKAVSQSVRGSGLKLQAAIEGGKVRVSGKSRDDLQAAIAHLRKLDIPAALSFNNFRD